MATLKHKGLKLVLNTIFECRNTLLMFASRSQMWFAAHTYSEDGASIDDVHDLWTTHGCSVFKHVVWDGGEH